MIISLLILFVVEYASWSSKLGTTAVAFFLTGFNIGSATILWIYMTDTLNDTTVTATAFLMWVFYGG